MIPPLSICLRSGPPGRFDDTNIYMYIYIHTPEYTKGIRLLRAPYLPGSARTHTATCTRVDEVARAPVLRQRTH